MTPSGPLLAVHAHPDDESLATGALLATWAAAGERAVVVTCTRGERGEVIDAPAHPTGLGHLEGDGPALAAHRERELAVALAALGVEDHLFLDAVPVPDGGTAGRFEDSGMRWVGPGIAGPVPESGPAAFARIPLDDAARRLAAVIREVRPAVVVTYEAGGGYGHPDHVRAHEVVVRALSLAADAEAVVVGEPWSAQRWEVVVPSSALRAGRSALVEVTEVRRLVDSGFTLADPDGELPPVAVDDVELARDEVDVVQVDVAAVLDRLLAALRAHRTQVQQVAPCEGSGVVAHYALSNDELAPVLATCYLRVVRDGAERGASAQVGSTR